MTSRCCLLLVATAQRCVQERASAHDVPLQPAAAHRNVSLSHFPFRGRCQCDWLFADRIDAPLFRCVRTWFAGPSPYLYCPLTRSHPRMHAAIRACVRSSKASTRAASTPWTPPCCSRSVSCRFRLCSCATGPGFFLFGLAAATSLARCLTVSLVLPLPCRCVTLCCCVCVRVRSDRRVPVRPLRARRRLAVQRPRIKGVPLAAALPTRLPAAQERAVAVTGHWAVWSRKCTHSAMMVATSFTHTNQHAKPNRASSCLRRSRAGQRTS